MEKKMDMGKTIEFTVAIVALSINIAIFYAAGFYIVSDYMHMILCAVLIANSYLLFEVFVKVYFPKLSYEEVFKEDQA